MDNLDELIEIFTNSKDKQTTRKLLTEILTKSELEDLAKRWFILKELYKGTSQRDIAKEMEVSLCKITRGSRILKQDNSEFRKILYDLFDETHL